MKKESMKGFNSLSRTENVVRNANVALVCQAINTILGFVSRSVFISTLGNSYLGVNGIFSNILTILSFAELGLGAAIVYYLYKPLLNKDKKLVGLLISFYQRAYRVIAIAIFVVGLALIPFLNYLIKEQPDIKESITVLYVMYLFSTTTSYFAAHKKSLLIADQKQHITSAFHQLIHVLQVVFQIIFLIITKEYLVFLSIQIICTILENVLISKEVDKLYPFLKEYKGGMLDADVLCGIKENVGSLFIYKINSAIVHGTDNLLIAGLIKDGVQTVGLYSNYFLITETANTILGIITNALTPSIGNLNASDNKDKQEKVFYTTLFISVWLYGYVCSGVLSLSSAFVTCWIGKNYILDTAVVFAIALQLYIRGVHYAAYTYRVTCGLFVQAKYVPILTSLVNLFLSIWWGLKWGLFGILFATSVARIVTIGIFDPVLVFKNKLNKNPIRYYCKYIYYLILTIGLFFVSNFVVSFVDINGWIGFIVKFLVFSLIYNFFFAIVNCKNNDLMYLFISIKEFIKRLK